MENQNAERGPQPTQPKSGGLAGAFLDGVEWVGNKLPDPAVLFLLGAIIVLGMSHALAPTLPDGFEVRWANVGEAAGGVDKHAPSIIESATGRTAKVRAVETSDGGYAAQLFIEGADTPVLDDAQRPLDFRDRGWTVFIQRPMETVDPATGETSVELKPTGEVNIAVSLLTTEGIYWVLKSMEDNFMGFAPLGVVLVGILGIGVAEKTGLIAALLKTFMLVVPRNFLTPTMVFLGVMSSIGSDAGYIVLPPLAAAIYLAAGRSPLAGIAAVFAGVSRRVQRQPADHDTRADHGSVHRVGAQVIDTDRVVAPTASVVLHGRLHLRHHIRGLAHDRALRREAADHARAPEDGGPDPDAGRARGRPPWTARSSGWLATILGIAGGVTMLVAGLNASDRPFARIGMAILLVAAVPGVSGAVYALAKKGLDPTEAKAVLVAMLFLTGLPALDRRPRAAARTCSPRSGNTALSGMDGVFQRWVAVVVPIIFFVFVIPGYAYGIVNGRGSKTPRSPPS
jgi:hypothetical protein